MAERLILQNRLSPGDCLMMTPAIRDLHRTYPGEYETDVRSPCGEIFQHNPYVTPVPDGQRLIDMQYPLIHESGATGRHFSEGHREFLAEAIGRPIKNHGMKPEIYLSQDEINWPSPVTVEEGYAGPYWIINAGIKNDYPLKHYPYYQEVVDALSPAITFVQVGHTAHNHPPLRNVIDMRGKTNSLRQLFRLSYHAQGAICPVTFQMVIMAAWQKPCVVINGGREGIRWQHYPNHRFLAVNGALRCCSWDGCWRSTKEQCVDWLRKEDVAHCMQMIRPRDVARAVELYYEGGVLSKEEALV